MTWQQELARTEKELNAVSPTFCLAKWLQVTLHLQNGFNHSCHHPRLHHTPLSELARGGTALHNTAHKKELRKLMLKGKRPEECRYCWEVEDRGGHFSDRVIKSNDAWASGRLAGIVAADPSADINPSYLEVSFSSLCNFRCVYCLPHVSSSLWSQYEKYGAYEGQPSLAEVTRAGLAPITGENPYVEAFWSWLPELSQELKVLRVTGGEPLLGPDISRLLQYFVREREHPGLELCVNTNLGVPEKHFDSFLRDLSNLETKQLKNFRLFTSADTAGPHAEYLREGLNYSRWLERIERYLDAVPWDLTVMCAFNALSVPRFPAFLADLRRVGRGRVLLDISHLTHPAHLSISVLPGEWLAQIPPLVGQMDALGFSDYEKGKLARVAALASAAARDSESSKAKLRAAFFRFTEQVKEREGKTFTDVFPEFAAFFETCRAEAAPVNSAAQESVSRPNSRNDCSRNPGAAPH